MRATPPGGGDRPGAGGAAQGRRRGRRRPGRRWYRHRFHNATSLRLILGIVPRLPRWLVPPVGAATATLCLAAMRHERRAARRNLAVVTGRRGLALWAVVWRLFYGFSRFMTSQCDLVGRTPDALRARVDGGVANDAPLRAARRRGRGVVVLTAHVGNWEVGARLLARPGTVVHVVMHADRTSAAERWLMQRRPVEGLRTVRVGRDPTALLALRAALQRDEIVAMQGDRTFGGRAVEVTLCGAPFRLPLGPFLLAYHAGAPIVPAFVLQDGWWRWRSEFSEPIEVAATGDAGRDAAAAARRFAERLDSVVRRHPDQWFNFFDLWPEGAPGAAGRRPREAA